MSNRCSASFGKPSVRMLVFGEIVGQGVKLETDGVVAELLVRQGRPFYHNALRCEMKYHHESKFFPQHD